MRKLLIAATVLFASAASADKVKDVIAEMNAIGKFLNNNPRITQGLETPQVAMEIWGRSAQLHRMIRMQQQGFLPPRWQTELARRLQSHQQLNVNGSKDPELRHFASLLVLRARYGYQYLHGHLPLKPYVDLHQHLKTHSKFLADRLAKRYKTR